MLESMIYFKNIIKIKAVNATDFKVQQILFSFPLQAGDV